MILRSLPIVATPYVYEHTRKRVYVRIFCLSTPPQEAYIHEKTCSALRADIFEYVTYLKTYTDTLENACVYVCVVSLYHPSRAIYNKRPAPRALGVHSPRVR